MTSVALAGSGFAGRIHAAAATTAAGVSIRQVTSRTVDVASVLGSEIGVDHGTLAELTPSADVVVIATPPPSHLELSLQAVARGQAILLEKPLTATLSEADALITAVDAAGVPAGYAENLLFCPAIEKALEHRRGLGPLRHLSARTEQPPPDWGHFLEPLEAGGTLYDLGPHAIALLLSFLGDDQPTWVRATLESSRPDGADDHAVVRIGAGHVVAEATVSWRAPAATWDLQAASDDGVVRVELVPRVEVESHGLDVTPEVAGDPVVDLGYVAQLQGLADALGGRGGRICPLGFGRRVLEVICAAYLSAHDGSEVALPYDGPRDRTPLSLWRDGR
jgi:predicted dehydrogenase